MAKAKTDEPKQLLEREYIVPLRRAWLKVPKYKRTNKAVKALKEFIAKHMKVYDRDLRKIKIDIILNNELRFRGMKKPPAKIKVKAIKFDNGIVRVELVEIPEHIKFARLREKKPEVKKSKEEEKPKEEKKEVGEKDEKEESEEEEKKESLKEEGLKLAKKQAKELKHISKDKDVKIQRKALSR